MEDEAPFPFPFPPPLVLCFTRQSSSSSNSAFCCSSWASRGWEGLRIHVHESTEQLAAGAGEGRDLMILRSLFSPSVSVLAPVEREVELFGLQ